MQDPMEVYIDDEAKLTLHGLQQHYVKLKDSEKNRKLFELLDVLEFNQVCVLCFMSSLLFNIICPTSVGAALLLSVCCRSSSLSSLCRDVLPWLSSS